MRKRQKLSSKSKQETFRKLLEADATLYYAANRLRRLELENFALRVDEVREAIANECGTIQAGVYKALAQAPRPRARLH